MTQLYEYRNLSRGLLVPLSDNVDAGYVRIQSTACEQKRWVTVLRGVGPDVTMRLAEGNVILIHDQSEKDRQTRALWQGVPFIRRTYESLWRLPLTPIQGRGGLAMEQYFDYVIRNLPRDVKKGVTYYKQFVSTKAVHLLAAEPIK